MTISRNIMMMNNNNNQSTNNDAYENYDFDSLGSIDQNVLDNNLSKSKKEAVLLRRLTDRRRKPSKKFRHTRFDPNEYSNNPFVDEFLNDNRLKKSCSTDLLDNSYDDSSLNQTTKSVDEIENDYNNDRKLVGNNNNFKSVKLRPSANGINRRMSSSQMKTHSVCFLPSESSITRLQSFRNDATHIDDSSQKHQEKEIEIKIDLSQKKEKFNNDVESIKPTKSATPFSLKTIEKQGPKIIRFNPNENSTPTNVTQSNTQEIRPTSNTKPTNSKSTFNMNPSVTKKDINIVKNNNINETSTQSSNEFKNHVSKLRSNSFQRPNYNVISSTKIENQQLYDQTKLKSINKEIENSENIKPPSTPTTINNSSTPPAFSTQNLYKKPKTDINNNINNNKHNNEQQGKIIINVSYNNPPISGLNNNNNNRTSNVNSTNNNNNNNNNNNSKQIVHQMSTNYNNVLTDNNNKIIETNTDIPSWKLELMKRKRNSNKLTTEKLINVEENRLISNSNSIITNTPLSNQISTPKNENNYQVTSILVQPARQLKPTFQSNFINKQDDERKSTNTHSSTIESKLIHNSIGSPIILTTMSQTTNNTINNKNIDIPEWKRTLLEKKKLKKNF